MATTEKLQEGRYDMLICIRGQNQSSTSYNMYHFPILVIYRLSVSEFGSSIICISSDCEKPIVDFKRSMLPPRN